MRRLGVAVLPVLAACGFSVANSDAPDTVDAPPDADPGCVASWPFAPSNFTPCTTPVHATVVLDSGAYTYTPATGVLTNGGTPRTLPSAGSPRVLAVSGFEIRAGVSLQILGTEPLIIAVYGNATIAGVLTVSASASTPGAGAATCIGPAGQDGDSAFPKSGGGGGAGGAFGTLGAQGGTGDTSETTKTPGGAEMAPEGNPMLQPLRGGCRGGSGGQEHDSAMADPGVGGGGGGAIQLTVRDALVLSATARVEASGGGGGGANGISNGAGTHEGAGGGGGGSGGAIFLEGHTIMIASTVTVCANGGGGGGGSHNTSDGGPGADGPCAIDDAAGGTSNSTGVGGLGSTLGVNPTPGGAGAGADAGGGGGGGGAGRIRIRAASGAAPSGFIVSPLPVLN